MSVRSCLFNNIVTSFSTEIKQFTKRQKAAFYAMSVFGACFLGFFFLSSAKYSADFSVDEGFYLSTCERLLRGDRLILHDWLLPQFVSLFQIIPYSLYKKIVGSTDGIILFMRYVTVCVILLNYCYILFKHKKRPWIALATAFLFCSFVPLDAFFLGYYTLPLMFLFAVVSVIIDEEAKLRKLRLVLAGILLSGAVILVPGLTLVWIIYSAFVAIRFYQKKKQRALFAEYDFLLSTDTFIYLLTGVLISAAALLLCFQFTCGLQNVIKMLPNLRVHTEYSDYSFTLLQNRSSYTILRRYYLSAFILNCIGLLFSFLFHFLGHKIRYPAQARVAMLFFTLVAYAASFYAVFNKQIVIMETPAFIALFGLSCFLLCSKKEPKMFLVLMLGIIYSFIQDFTSEISCCFGCILCVFPTIVLLSQLVTECYDELFEPLPANGKKKSLHKKKRTDHNRMIITFSQAFGILSFVLIFTWSVTNVIGSYYNLHRITTEESGATATVKAQYKGIIMPEMYNQLYDDLLTDLDLCKEMTDGPVYVLGTYPFAYLYLDRDIPVASTFNALEQMNRRYWEVYPERRPDCVYIPIEETDSSINISKEEFEAMPETQFVDYDFFEGKAIKGSTGLIVHVTKWH